MPPSDYSPYLASVAAGPFWKLKLRAMVKNFKLRNDKDAVEAYRVIKLK